MKTGIAFALALSLLVIAPAAPARAELSAAATLKALRTPAIADVAKAYIDGAVAALVAADGLLIATNRGRFYCQPTKLGLTESQAISILQGYIDRHPVNDPLGIVLLVALMDTFPCSEGVK
jgi:hypothetical protein